MSDNPYRFTVKVVPPDKHYSDKWWDVVLADNDGTLMLLDSCTTEAEANLHADLILRALREAGREG